MSLSKRQRWGLLVTVAAGLLLITLDNSILYTALPTLTEELGASGSQSLWIINAYPVVMAGLLLGSGTLGDRIGHRRMFLIGLVVFGVASLGAAFAPSAGLLIAARAVLAVGAAAMMPATLALIRVSFEVERERNFAIAVWGSLAVVGAALGPIVGGVLLEHFWWGSVFLMAVPMLLPLLIGGMILVPESKDPNPGRVDPFSILLVVFTLLPFVYAIKTAVSAPWYFSAAAIVLAIVCGVAFVRRQLKSQQPMLDVRLFSNALFSGALMVNLIGIFSLVGFIYFVSQHLQLIAGFSPLQAGLWMTPGLVLTMGFGLLSVALSRRFGTPNVMAIGLILSAVAYLMVIMAGEGSNTFLLLAAFAVLGTGIGMTETLSNDMVLAAVPASKAGAASAISETAYEVGSVLGVAVLGTILNTAYTSRLLVPGSLTDTQAQLAGETLGGAHHVAASLQPADAQALLDSAALAFDHGVVLTSGIAAVLSLVAAAVVFRVIKPAFR